MLKLMLFTRAVAGKPVGWPRIMRTNDRGTNSVYVLFLTSAAVVR